MIPEIGHFSLVVGLVIALGLALLPLYGSLTGNTTAMRSGFSLSAALFVFLAISMGCLAVAFAQDDFSVRYVATNSNTQLPLYYKLSAIWGGHEGSLLLWALILSVWTMAVAVLSRSLPLEMRANVVAVLGMVAVGFLWFMLATSNPFDRVLPFPEPEGRDLNPLLQDIGLILHPPMLYLGYVGFSVPFAFAIAALIGGRLDSAWARWSRPWANAAWVFLTLGIALGSWWAYYELGWGGWWFWDPVENASFMPWLVGTALVHSLAVTEKRGVFRSWTVLLAIAAFSLSLLGTFLVRSGVLVSVHAFASDPSRGMFILIFLLVVVGGSLLLYGLRAPAVGVSGSFRFWSRETFLLVNNLVFLVAALTVLAGTLFPLLMDALELGKYSVGPPYFNAVFLPLMALLLVFMGVGPLLNWKQNRVRQLLHGLVAPALAAVIAGALLARWYGGHWHLGASLGMALGLWLVLTALGDIRHRIRHAPGVISGLARLGRSYWGMLIAHLGFALTTIGVAMVASYSVERDFRMVSGDSVAVGGYDFRFLGSAGSDGPNYHAEVGHVTVSKDGVQVLDLHPEKRRYNASGQVMTEAAIDPGITRDLFVAMGDPLDDNAWAVRIQHKPFIRWIWGGALVMALGAIIATLDKRYRRPQAAGGA